MRRPEQAVAAITTKGEHRASTASLDKLLRKQGFARHDGSISADRENDGEVSLAITFRAVSILKVGLKVPRLANRSSLRIRG